MANHTIRERLWTLALKRTHRRGEAITVEDLVRATDATERSTRDALKTIVDGIFSVKITNVELSDTL